MEEKTYQTQEETTYFPHEEVLSDADEHSEVSEASTVSAEASAVNAEAEIPVAKTEGAAENQENSEQSLVPQLECTSRRTGCGSDSDIEVISEEKSSWPYLRPFHDMQPKNSFPDSFTDNVIQALSNLQDHQILPEEVQHAAPEETDSDVEVISEEKSLGPYLRPFHDMQQGNYIPDSFTDDVIQALHLPEFATPNLQGHQILPEEIQHAAPEETSPRGSENCSPRNEENRRSSEDEIFAMSLSEGSSQDGNEESNLVEPDIVVDSHKTTSKSNLVNPDILVDSLKTTFTRENTHKNEFDSFWHESRGEENPNVNQVASPNDMIIGVYAEERISEDVELSTTEKEYQTTDDIASLKSKNANEENLNVAQYVTTDYNEEIVKVMSERITVGVMETNTAEKEYFEKKLDLEGENKVEENLDDAPPSEFAVEENLDDAPPSEFPIETNIGAEGVVGCCIEKNITENIEDEVFVSNTSSVPNIAKLPVKTVLPHNIDSNNPGSSKFLTKAEYDLAKRRDGRHWSDSSIEEAQEAYEALHPDNFRKNGNENTDNVEKSYEFNQIETSTSSSDFVDVSFEVEISKAHIAQVLKRMKENHYMADGNEEDLKMYSYCKYLFEKDYQIKVINNEGGTLSKNYPARIIVPFIEKDDRAVSDDGFDPMVYRELTVQSSGARCRDRFVAPTIFYKGKYICQSATLTVRKSAVYETATKSPPPKEVEVDPGSARRILKHVRARSETFVHRTSQSAEALFKLMDVATMAKHREEDKKLLEYCNVLYISDLMVEDGKKKYWISVSASEKMYQETYRKFEILQMPYPGCKFFKRYHDAGRIPDGLIFDWKRSDVNAILTIPNRRDIMIPEKEWAYYQEWDVVELTQNYMELIINYFYQGDMGMLIHCISGWDRTPLFIALLRISLWADGLIHRSLNAHEMAYLTLAYDWYLFGHDLPGRLKKKEEIMHFCYKFLEYFLEDYFSVALMYNNAYLGTRHYDRASFMRFIPKNRAAKIQELKNIVLPLYEEHVLKMS